MYFLLPIGSLLCELYDSIPCFLHATLFIFFSFLAAQVGLNNIVVRVATSGKFYKVKHYLLIFLLSLFVYTLDIGGERETARPSRGGLLPTDLCDGIFYDSYPVCLPRYIHTLMQLTCPLLSAYFHIKSHPHI